MQTRKIQAKYENTQFSRGTFHKINSAHTRCREGMLLGGAECNGTMVEIDVTQGMDAKCGPNTCSGPTAGKSWYNTQPSRPASPNTSTGNTGIRFVRFK